MVESSIMSVVAVFIVAHILLMKVLDGSLHVGKIQLMAGLLSAALVVIVLSVFWVPVMTIFQLIL